MLSLELYKEQKAELAKVIRSLNLADNLVDITHFLFRVRQVMLQEMGLPL